MKQCPNCQSIIADGVTFCPKCGTSIAPSPAPASPASPAAPAAPTAPAAPAPGPAPVAPAAPATPSTPPAASLNTPLGSSAINGFGTIAPTTTPTPAPAPTPSPISPISPTNSTDSTDPLVSAASAADAGGDKSKDTPITPDTPPKPLGKKATVSGKGFDLKNKRTLILIAIVAVLLIAAGVFAFMFLMPQGNNSSSSNTATPVTPPAETTTPATTNEVLLSGYSFEVPSDYSMELFNDINGNPVLQIANSDSSWVMDLTYLSSTLFSSVSAEGAIDNQIMLLNAQTNSESTSGQANLSDLDLSFIATNYNGTPVTIVYASAPAVEGAANCTFAGIIVSAGGESGENVLAPAAEILASAKISTANPLSGIAEGTDFNGLISILGQGFNGAAEVTEPTPTE